MVTRYPQGAPLVVHLPSEEDEASCLTGNTPPASGTQTPSSIPWNGRKLDLGFKRKCSTLNNMMLTQNTGNTTNDIYFMSWE